MKKLFPVLSFCLALCLALASPALAVTLEQVQASPPRFDVYVYDEGADLGSVSAADVTATLGDQALECTDVSQSEQGIFYFFMLDISGSIPSAHFEAAKAAVLDTYASLREQDKLAVITFGNDVTLLLDGDESKEEVSSALSSLSPDDKNTMFYTAMDKLIETASQAQEMRRIAVVISDGIDDSDAGMTQDELEEKLVNCGISVYALCIDSSNQASTDSFRSFIRLSGGELYTFSPESAETVLDELLTRLSRSLRIELMSKDAIPTDSELALTVNIGSFGSVSATLSPDEWIADSTEPYIESAAFSLNTQTLDIVFSEPVTGADDIANYKLTDSSGNNVPFASAAYTSGNRSAVSLTFAEVPPEGDFTLEVGGITDVSTAQNALHHYKGSLHLVTGVTDDQTADEGLKKDIITYIIVGVIAIALITGLAVGILKFSKTDAKGKDAGGKLSAEDKKKIKKAAKKEKAEKKKEERFIFTNAVDKSDKNTDKNTKE